MASVQDGGVHKGNRHSLDTGEELGLPVGAPFWEGRKSVARNCKGEAVRGVGAGGSGLKGKRRMDGRGERA